MELQEAKNRANDIAYFYKTWGKSILNEELNKQKDILADMAWDEQEFYVVKGRIKQLKDMISLFESECLFAVEKTDE